MTRTISTTTEALLIAIDIAKYAHVALIEYPDGHRKSVRFKSTQQDFARIEKLFKASGLPVIIPFEPTEDYHRTLAYHLQIAGFQCHFVSSIAVARTRETLFNSWDKNDPKDAQVILHLIKTDMLKIYHDPLIHHFNDIQELSNTYHQISKRKTRIYHTIVNHYFTLYFPEIEHYFHSTRGKWLINFLLMFPTPGSIVALSKEYC